MTYKQLINEKLHLEEKYNQFKNMHLHLDMSRGKPAPDQLDISMPMLNVINKSSDLTVQGTDYRNYGMSDGIPEIKNLFSKIIGVEPKQLFIGGNSSLNMMFDVISCMMTHGVCGCKPLMLQKNIKFLCPVPGYDRHFDILSYYNINTINIPMTHFGPDMDLVQQLVENDSSIKGIWCVPKYSNPLGITYSDEVVKRFSMLKPAAKDFRIFWDNAYAVHSITEKDDNLLNLMDECKKYGSEDMIFIFASTSKITFPGSGVAAIAASDNNLKDIRKRYSIQTIGFDKINQLRHAKYFMNYENLINHMKKCGKLLKPKFDTVINKLTEEFKENSEFISWTRPNGGYFISVNVCNGCAKRVVELCKNAGVTLTPAGATYPYKIDPNDSNIRLAPTYPSIEELNLAMDLFCICVKLAVLEKKINSL